jgi:hypothetical protein
VVAQALDYASWVEDLKPEEIAAIYARFSHGGNLAADFQTRFGQPLDEETLNDTHQIVVVASSLDASSERIIGYLNRRGVAINVLFFQVFAHGEQKLLSRAWLIDPVDVQVQAAATGTGRAQEPWNGEFYVSFGDPINRRWDEAVKYGFISAGGGAWYPPTPGHGASPKTRWVQGGSSSLQFCHRAFEKGRRTAKIPAPFRR